MQFPSTELRELLLLGSLPWQVSLLLMSQYLLSVSQLPPSLSPIPFPLLQPFLQLYSPVGCTKNLQENDEKRGFSNEIALSKKGAGNIDLVWFSLIPSLQSDWLTGYGGRIELQSIRYFEYAERPALYKLLQ